MSYYPELKSHIRDKVKVVLDLSSYSTKKRIRSCYRCWYIDLAAQKDFIALKAEVDKLDINKFVHIPTSLNHLKWKVDDLDVSKLKTVPIDLKKLSNVVDNGVVRNAEFNTLKTFVYQPTLDTLELKKDKGTDYILSSKSNGVYNSKLKPLYTAFLYSIKLSGEQDLIKIL